MPTTYDLTNTASDLTGGTDFTNALVVGGGAATISVSAANGTTETNYGFTEADNPAAQGTSTGTFTVTINVTAGNAAYFIAIALARVNSAGGQLATTATSTEQAASAGTKSFPFTNPALGTWAAGNRLRVLYRVRNSQSMGGAGSVDFDSTVGAPWTLTMNWSRTPADTFGLTDDATPTHTPGGTPHSVTPADTLGLTDTATPTHTPGGGGPAKFKRRVILRL